MAHKITRLQGVTERLREAVKASGKSPAQIQRETGISKTTFYSHLNGETAMSELFIAKYCATLGVSADWLLGLRR